MSEKINEKQKSIRYLLPIDMQFRSLPENKVIVGYKETLPLLLTEEELAKIKALTRQADTSLDQALLEYYEQKVNRDEYVQMLLFELKQKHPGLNKLTVKLKLTGKVNEAKEPQIEVKHAKEITLRKGAFIPRKKLTGRQIIVIVALIGFLTLIFIVLFLLAFTKKL